MLLFLENSFIVTWFPITRLSDWLHQSQTDWPLNHDLSLFLVLKGVSRPALGKVIRINPNDWVHLFDEPEFHQTWQDADLLHVLPHEYAMFNCQASPVTRKWDYNHVEISVLLYQLHHSADLKNCGFYTHQWYWCCSNWGFWIKQGDEDCVLYDEVRKMWLDASLFYRLLIHDFDYKRPRKCCLLLITWVSVWRLMGFSLLTNQNCNHTDSRVPRLNYVMNMGDRNQRFSN